MYEITIRFYEELNDFLLSERKKKDIEFSFKGRRSIKDLIESFGVPHVEVDLILVNGVSVNFSHIVCNKDRISVYPVFESFDIKNVTHLRPSPLRNTKFVLDVHLRKLAKRMRLLGFDVDYKEDRNDKELAEISDKEKRILLTRDRQLLMHKIVSKGIYVRNIDAEKQILEVLNRLDLWNMCVPFKRCLECNGIIKILNTESDNFNNIKSKIPEGVKSWCKEYYYCSDCNRIYWKGSHYEKLKERIDKIYSAKKENE